MHRKNDLILPLNCCLVELFPSGSGEQRDQVLSVFARPQQRLFYSLAFHQPQQLLGNKETQVLVENRFFITRITQCIY